MKAKFWTNGSGIFKLAQVLEFTNLETGEVTRRDSFNEAAEFVPLVMPKIKKRTPKVKKRKAQTTKPLRRGAKSEYKGVQVSGKKFTGSYWDGKNKKSVHLGSFDIELEAAAAVQHALGNHQEAKRLLNEYQEGNGAPENLAMRPSEQ